MNIRDDIEYLVSVIASCEFKAVSEIEHEFNESAIRIAEEHKYIKNDGHGSFMATPIGHKLANYYVARVNQTKTACWIMKNCKFSSVKSIFLE